MEPGPLRQLVQSGLIKPQRQLGKGTKRPPEGLGLGEEVRGAALVMSLCLWGGALGGY